MSDRKTGTLSTGWRGGTLYRSGGRWYGRVSVNGRRFTVATKCTTRVEAERFLNDYTMPLRSGGKKEKLERIAAEIRIIDADIEEERRRANDYQLEELTQRVVAIRPMSKSTRIDYRAALAALRRFVEDNNPGINRMSQITKDLAMQFRDHLAERVKGGTANLYLTKLKATWSALASDVGTPNPWKGLKVAGRSAPRKDLTDDEFQAIMSEARKHGGDVAYMFELAASTAMRMSDCCLLKWDDIDMGRRTITITPRKLRRHGKIVQIPMSQTVLDLLSSRAGEGTQSGFVAPKLASAWACNFAQRRARRVFAAAGIPPRSGKSFHSLRVHAITRMLDAGIPMATVQAIAGHASPEMTQHYYRMDLDRAREAIDRLSASNGHTEETPKTTTGGGDILSVLATLSREHRAALKQLL